MKGSFFCFNELIEKCLYSKSGSSSEFHSSVEETESSLGLVPLESNSFSKDEADTMEESKRSSSLESSYLNQIPESLHKFLGEVWDPIGDGNCGFRVISKSLWYDEDGWFKFWKRILEKLRKNKRCYSVILGGSKDVEKIEQKLDVNDINEKIPSLKWLSILFFSVHIL